MRLWPTTMLVLCLLAASCSSHDVQDLASSSNLGMFDLSIDHPDSFSWDPEADRLCESDLVRHRMCVQFGAGQPFVVEGDIEKTSTIETPNGFVFTYIDFTRHNPGSGPDYRGLVGTLSIDDEAELYVLAGVNSDSAPASDWVIPMIDTLRLIG